MLKYKVINENKVFREVVSQIKFNNYYPFLLNNMQSILQRVVTAINNREKIVIFGYYDVESITSVSTLFLALKYLKADVEYFIPSEIDRAKMLMERDIKEHIEFLGTKLVISLGCFINSEIEKNLCKALGIDVITLSSDICCKDNKYILSPKDKDSQYPFKDFSCSGVTYKLIQSLSCYYKTNKFNKYIDLISLGTLANGEKITGENKYIINEGIQQIKKSNNYGIRALIKIHKINNINVKSVQKLVSTIIPKINPIGNMDNAKIIVELFTTEDRYKADQIAKYLYKERIKREIKAY